MRVINIDINDPVKFDVAIKEVVKCLQSGGSVVYPTDTLYGLGCDALNEKAVDVIFRIKRRSLNKAVSVMVRDIEEIKKFAYLNEKKETIAKKLLPGQFTLIFQSNNIIPNIVGGGKTSIGFRVPDCEVTKKICENYENPIVTTSVNLAGKEPLNDPFKIVDLFRNIAPRPDLILDFGKINNPIASTVIDLSGKNPRIVRSGIKSVKETMELLEKLK
jgi:tRNA threonylcarbamoyl adenosine modification protein (Sua5/YciO/YrdC/YwlC family)